MPLPSSWGKLVLFSSWDKSVPKNSLKKFPKTLDILIRLCYNKTIERGKTSRKAVRTMTDKNGKLWMNRETGELLTYEEAWEQGAEWYDLDDDTNAVQFAEYYEMTDDDVPEDWDDWKDGEPADIDDDCGFDPYEGCYTWDC